MSKIENFKYSISESFGNCYYLIPDYQREYVWTEKEVNKLLEDIDDGFLYSNSSEYFIGTILVSKKNGNSHYDVIDGQQRLTTLFLILCSLKVKLKNLEQVQSIIPLISSSFTNLDGKTIKTLKLSPQYTNALDVLLAIIESEDNINEIGNSLQAKGIIKLGALENLINSYVTIFKHLETNYKKTDELIKYWGYLSNQVVFIQISTDVSSALKIFETINATGIGLNPMDLLKNLLFSNVDQEEFTKLKEKWNEVKNPLDKEKEKHLRFLRYFLMANYTIKNERNDSTIREDDIYDWITNKNNVSLTNYKEDPFSFVRSLKSNVENYMILKSGKGNDGRDNEYMKNIRTLTGGAFSLHNILLLASFNLEKELFDHLIKQLETFLFYYIITRTATKELERNFSIWATELKRISSLVNYDDKKVELNKFINDNFRNNVHEKEQPLEDSLRRYNFNSFQQYRTKYILSKMAQYVDVSFKGLAKNPSLDDYLVLEFEHILPNNPTIELKTYFEEKNPLADYETNKLKLGNFTLLEKPLNIVAGREFFEIKTKEYKKSKNYFTSSIAEKHIVGNNTSINRINDNLIEFKSWGANAIDERQEMMIKLAKSIWTINNID